MRCELCDENIGEDILTVLGICGSCAEELFARIQTIDKKLAEQQQFEADVVGASAERGVQFQFN